jgi:hypothetical protein
MSTVYISFHLLNFIKYCSTYKEVQKNGALNAAPKWPITKWLSLHIKSKYTKDILAKYFFCTLQHFGFSYVKKILSLEVSIFLNVVSIESLDLDTAKCKSWQLRKSRHFQKVGIDNRDISIKIEISRFSLDGHMQIQYFSTEIETYWDLSRLLWFLWISWLFLDLNWEITWFFTYLDWDFYFKCRNIWKVVGEGFTLTFISLPWASPTTFHRCLKSKISQ